MSKETDSDRIKDLEERLSKLRIINSNMREMLEFMRHNEASISIRPTKFPDFVYEKV